MTLLGCISAEFEKKGEKNCKILFKLISRCNVVYWTKSKAFYSASRIKLKSSWSVFLLWDNLKKVAEDVKRSKKITKKGSYRKDVRVINKKHSQNNTGNSFLENKKYICHGS